MDECIFVQGTPRLALHYQRSSTGATRGNVLYVHGATFPTRLAVGFRFDGWSWADDLAAAGFAVWGVDFAGYGDSERYPEMAGGPDEARPVGRVVEASEQIYRAVGVILERQQVSRVSLVAHSWGTLAAGYFAAQFPELVERLVLFGPIARRDGAAPGACPAYRDITLQAQWHRFIEDVPEGEEPVFSRRHFAEWGHAYLASDPASDLAS
ncbi:MAG TPA: alpha/beta fold hydrolase, partial [Ktedonobacterales bacterium]